MTDLGRVQLANLPSLKNVGPYEPHFMKFAVISAAFFHTTAAHAQSRPMLDAIVLGAAQGLLLGILGLVYFVWKRHKSRRLSEKIASSLPDIVLWAAEGNNARVAELLDNGTDPNVAGPSGQTALMLAARNGHTGTIELLLDRGADVGRQMRSGGTAEEIAKTYRQRECEALLARHRVRSK